MRHVRGSESVSFLAGSFLLLAWLRVLYEVVMGLQIIMGFKMDFTYVMGFTWDCNAFERV